MNIFRIYNEDELMLEYFKLAGYSPKILKKTNIGYKCSNAFFQKERFNTATGEKLTTISFWKKYKQKVIKYAETRAGDLYRHLQFLNHTPSQFPPSVATWFYLKFGATSVFDPFAGWGDRCIAAMAKGIDYTGVDSNINLKSCYSNMVNFFPHEGNVKIIFRPVEKVNISKIPFDFVFSSPPFWNVFGRMVEQYNNQQETRYEAFMNTILAPIIVNCRKKAWVCLNMPPHMADYLKDIGIDFSIKYSYESQGNKCRQNYAVYCYAKI